MAGNGNERSSPSGRTEEINGWTVSKRQRKVKKKKKVNCVLIEVFCNVLCEWSLP